MSKFTRLVAVAAIAAVPVTAVVATASAADSPYAPYAPYSPAPTPTPAPGPTPAPTVAPIPAVVLTNVEAAVAKAFKSLKFGRVLGQGHSTITIPIAGAGTYTVTISYRLPGKKYQSIAKGAIIVKTPGKTTDLAIKPNKHGQSVYKTLKKQKKKTIKVQITVSYETGGKTVQTTITKSFKK